MSIEKIACPMLNSDSGKLREVFVRFDSGQMPTHIMCPYYSEKNDENAKCTAGFSRNYRCAYESWKLMPTREGEGAAQ